MLQLNFRIALYRALGHIISDTPLAPVLAEAKQVGIRNLVVCFELNRAFKLHFGIGLFSKPLQFIMSTKYLVLADHACSP